jgi:hypothetical protein
MLRYAFVAQMQSGKDRACNLLVDKFGGDLMAFAKPVYEIEEFIWKTVGLPVPTDKKVRRPILQLVGTEIGRDCIDKDIWLNVFQRRLGEMNFGNVFVSDLRFANEVERVKKLGFKVFKITRPDEERLKHATSHESHPSETEMADIPDGAYTAIISNDGTLDEFDQKILALPGLYSPELECDHDWHIYDQDLLCCSKCKEKQLSKPGFLFAGIE